MEAANKGIVINAILIQLSDMNKRNNKELIKMNLYTEQKPFDYADTFFKLIFMQDKEIEKIANLCGI